jgi:hypothetical protein
MSNPSFKLGIACHESLEMAGKIWMEKGKLEKQDVKKILKFYDEVSVKEGIEEMEVHSIGRDLVKSRLDSFDLGTKIVSLEEQFGFPNSQHPDLKTPSGVPLIGAMDKVIELDEDTLLVVDYKTSKTAPTPDQLKSDLQLSLYDLVAQILYPQYKRVILCLDMLKSEPVYSYRTPEQRKEFSEYLDTVYEAMCSLKEDDVKPTLNVFCPWCDYKDYCEKYTDACTKSDYEFMPIANMSDDEIVAEWDMVKSTAKILDVRKRELDMIMMEKIKNSGSDLKGEEVQVFVRQNARTNYDAKTVKELVPYEDYVEMSSLNKKAVDSYCARNPKVKKNIMKAATTNFTSPFLATKKIKK